MKSLFLIFWVNTFLKLLSFSVPLHPFVSSTPYSQAFPRVPPPHLYPSLLFLSQTDHLFTQYPHGVTPSMVTLNDPDLQDPWPGAKFCSCLQARRISQVLLFRTLCSPLRCNIGWIEKSLRVSYVDGQISLLLIPHKIFLLKKRWVPIHSVQFSSTSGKELFSSTLRSRVLRKRFTFP